MDIEVNIAQKLDKLPVMAIICDKNGDIEYINNPMKQINSFFYKNIKEFLGIEFDIYAGFVEDVNISTQCFSGFVTLFITEIQNKFVIFLIDKTQTQFFEDPNLFVSNLSHEIRTPLNGIVGMLSLLEDASYNEEEFEYLAMANQSCVNLMKVIGDVLDYLRLVSGLIELNDSYFILKNCVENAYKMVFTSAKNKNINMKYTLDENLPIGIFADYHRITQILVNLLANAIKFTEKGLITTIVKKEEHAEDEIWIKFIISDSGCGISLENSLKLFHDFPQNITNNISQEGTGLGLVISKQLCKLMKGQIWLEKTELGVGSSFCFRIKCKTSSDNNNLQIFTNEMDLSMKNKKIIVVDDSIINRLKIMELTIKWGMIPFLCSTTEEALLYIKKIEFHLGLINIKMVGKKINLLGANFPFISCPCNEDLLKPLEENTLKKLCYDTIYAQNSVNFLIQILVAEDHYVNEKVIVATLKKLKYNNVTVVCTGKKVLSALHKNNYDIIFMDIKMPEMNGIQTFQELSKLYNPRPYCVALTALTMKGDSKYYVNNIGFDDYVSKPINTESLKKCLTDFAKKRVFK